MKKLRITALFLVLLLLFSSCTPKADDVPEEKPEEPTVIIEPEEESEPEPEPESEPEPEPEPIPEPEPDPEPEEEIELLPEPVPEPIPDPAPEHSELYIPGVSVEDVITYFNEVCLDSEYMVSESSKLLQRWKAPITYEIYGEATEEDRAKIASFAAGLCEIEGFPGMYEAHKFPNLKIYFCPYEEFASYVGDFASDELLDGAVTFWYDDIGNIYDAVICCSTEIEQNLRNSVIIEEIYNGLGPIQDTVLREDSIIYQYYTEAQELSDIDLLLLKLLYSPELECGMNADECAEIIRTLYY